MKNINYCIILLIIFLFNNAKEGFSNPSLAKEKIKSHRNIFFNNVITTRDSFKLKENVTAKTLGIPDSLFIRYKKIVKSQNKSIRKGNFIRYKDGFLNEIYKDCINKQTNELDWEAIKKVARKKTYTERFPMMIKKHGFRSGPMIPKRNTIYAYKLFKCFFYTINPITIFIEHIYLKQINKNVKKRLQKYIVKQK